MVTKTDLYIRFSRKDINRLIDKFKDNPDEDIHDLLRFANEGTPKFDIGDKVRIVYTSLTGSVENILMNTDFLIRYDQEGFNRTDWYGALDLEAFKDDNNQRTP